MKKCFLFHDWEILEEKYADETYKDVFDKYYNTVSSTLNFKGYHKLLKRKVCLRCGKVVDTIKKEEDKYLKFLIDSDNRRELAKGLVGEATSFRIDIKLAAMKKESN